MKYIEEEIFLTNKYESVAGKFQKSCKNRREI